MPKFSALLLPVVTISTLAAGLICAGSAEATTITAATELVSPSPATYDRFGAAVSVSADDTVALAGGYTGVLGSPTTPSSTYVLNNSAGTWSVGQQLTASDAQVGDFFGYALSMSADGTTAVIGSRRQLADGTQPGTVYVFTNSGGVWTQVQEIQSPAPVNGGEFGVSVSISSNGNDFVVGAAANGTSYTGAAYFYSRGTDGTWALITSASGTSVNALFGWGVAISGNGLVAAVAEPDYQYKSGTSTVYLPTVITYSRTSTANSWAYQKTISSPGGTGNLNNFGEKALSLSSTGTTLLVGAANQVTNAGQAVAGVGYLYSYGASSWGTPVAFTVAAPTSSTYRQLGFSVALAANGNAILMGEPQGSATTANGGGIAYEWTRATSTSSWSAAQAYGASDNASTDKFGYSVALPTNPLHPVISAAFKTVLGYSQAGATYLY